MLKIQDSGWDVTDHADVAPDAELTALIAGLSASTGSDLIGYGETTLTDSLAITAKQTGAAGDGVTDDTVAIQAAIIAASALKKNIDFGGLTYLLSSAVYIVSSNIKFSGGIFIIAGNVGFQVGVTNNSDTAVYENVTFTDMKFTGDIASTAIGQFLKIYQTNKASVRNCHFENGGNGALHIGDGCWYATVDNCAFSGTSAYATRRNIWINGSEHSSFPLQLMDTDTLERNATALPTTLTPFGTKISNVHIRNSVSGANYGIYNMNSRHTMISNCDIEGDARCIAVNNYSTDCMISDCILKDSFNTSGTGILVTQYSTATINNVKFTGSFGGNRAIYVQYGGYAKIDSCQFEDGSSNGVLIDMMGYADIDNCIFNRYFARTGRHISIGGIDTTGTFGNSMNVATTLIPTTTIKNCWFGSNVFQDVLLSNLSSSDATKVMSNNVLVFKDNVTKDIANKYIIQILGGNVMTVETGGTVCVDPLGDRVLVTSTAVTTNHRADQVMSTFKVDVVSGVYTVTAITKGNLTLAAAANGVNTGLAPRERLSGVASIMSIIPVSSNIDYYKIADWSSNSPVVTFYNSSGVAVPAASNTFSFYVVLVSRSDSGL